MVSILISPCSPKEAADFLKSLPQGSKSKALFRILRKQQDKETVFQLLYGKKYRAEKDYLLRAEKKLLKKKFEQFIYLQSSFDTTLNESYSVFYEMSKWCLKRGMYALAERYAKQAFVGAQAKSAWIDLLKINRWYYLVEFQMPIPFSAKLNLLQNRVITQKNLITTLFSEEFHYSQFMEASFEKLKMSAGLPLIQTEPMQEISIDLLSHNSPIGAYFYTKAMAFKTSGDKALLSMKQALELLEKTPPFYFKTTEQIAIKGALATEYTKQGLYAEAGLLYDSILNAPELPETIGSPNIHFNYLSMLLKSESYAKAKEVLLLTEKRHPNFNKNEQFQAMKINTYLFLDEIEKLKKSINEIKTLHNPHLKLYHRILLYIYYLKKGDYATAEREMMNMEKSKHKNTSKFAPLIPILKLYYEFMLNSGTKQKSINLKLKSMIQEINGDPENELNQVLPLKWVEYNLTK